jgi:hypothetical protein
MAVESSQFVKSHRDASVTGNGFEKRQKMFEKIQQ